MNWALIAGGVLLFLVWRANQIGAYAPGEIRTQPIGQPVLYETAPLVSVGGAPSIVCAGTPAAGPAIPSGAGPAVSYAPQSGAVGSVPTGDAVTLPAFITRSGALREDRFER